MDIFFTGIAACIAFAAGYASQMRWGSERTRRQAVIVGLIVAYVGTIVYMMIVVGWRNHCGHCQLA